MKTKTNFKHLGGASFWALLLLMLLCGNNAFANHWKGVPFVMETQENEWGRYYDDGNTTKGGGTRGETTVEYTVATSSQYYLQTATMPFFNANNAGACTEIIYSANNLENTAGTITKIAFYCSTATSGGYSGNK